jgi:DNA-binding transcriptional LysR family regulator
MCRGRRVNAHVSGRLVFNNGDLIVEAALAELGLAWIPNDVAARHVAAGRLLTVLDPWSISYPGYHLYYASRRASPALSLGVEAMRLAEGT